LIEQSSDEELGKSHFYLHHSELKKKLTKSRDAVAVGKMEVEEPDPSVL
jgi:hypothetical protein